MTIHDLTNTSTPVVDESGTLWNVDYLGTRSAVLSNDNGIRVVLPDEYSQYKAMKVECV